MYDKAGGSVGIDNLPILDLWVKSKGVKKNKQKKQRNKKKTKLIQ